jgi:hypothetical protein
VYAESATADCVHYEHPDTTSIEAAGRRIKNDAQGWHLSMVQVAAKHRYVHLQNGSPPLPDHLPSCATSSRIPRLHICRTYDAKRPL